MILREWRAEIRRSERDAYVAYVRATGLAGYAGTPGNLGSAIAVRDLDAERSEIVTFSYGSSMEAIAAFAGEPVDRARYYPEDDKYLLTRPDKVANYEVLGDRVPGGHRTGRMKAVRVLQSVQQSAIMGRPRLLRTQP